MINKLHDVYFMDRETGELIPGTDAIREFYKTHGPLDAWTDQFEETTIPVEDQFINIPDFTTTIK